MGKRQGSSSPTSTACCAPTGTCAARWSSHIAGGEVTDLRLRKLGEGQKTRSLPGAPTARGAMFPMGWDLLDGESDAVILTESGEYKTLIPNQEYQGGKLLLPTIGHPGLSNFGAEWGPLLMESGIKTVYVAYDSQPRLSNKHGLTELTPEEKQAIRVGHQLAASGWRFSASGCRSSLAKRRRTSTTSY